MFFSHTVTFSVSMSLFSSLPSSFIFLSLTRYLSISFCLSGSLSIFISVRLNIGLSVSPSFCLLVSAYLCLFVSLFVSVSIFVSVFLYHSSALCLYSLIWTTLNNKNQQLINWLIWYNNHVTISDAFLDATSLYRIGQRSNTQHLDKLF